MCDIVYDSDPLVSQELLPNYDRLKKKTMMINNLATITSLLELRGAEFQERGSPKCHEDYRTIEIEMDFKFSFN